MGRKGESEECRRRRKLKIRMGEELQNTGETGENRQATIPLKQLNNSKKTQFTN